MSVEKKKEKNTKTRAVSAIAIDNPKQLRAHECFEKLCHCMYATITTFFLSIDVELDAVALSDSATIVVKTNYYQCLLLIL